MTAQNAGTIVFSGVGVSNIQPQINVTSSAIFSSNMIATEHAQASMLVTTSFLGSIATTFQASNTFTMAPTDLALINNRNFDFLTFDDIMTSATKNLYLQTIHKAVLPQTVYFQSVRGVFAAEQYLLSTDPRRVVTPKGAFLPGQYLIYAIPIDKFSQLGVWTVFWIDGNAAFYRSDG